MRTTPVVGPTKSSGQRSTWIRRYEAVSPEESAPVWKPPPAISTVSCGACGNGVPRMRAKASQLQQAGQALSLRELELKARKLLDPVVYDFVAGAAEDEITL